MKHSREYELICHTYDTMYAVRSEVPYINHINEGLVVLQSIGARQQAEKAFCLHPLVQTDSWLEQHFSNVCLQSDPVVVALAMEYRSVANEYLSKRVITSVAEIRLSPLKDVNDMLIADKVQNYKDFLTYHKGTHPRSDLLDIYFNNWLSRLGISDNMFAQLCETIGKGKIMK